MTLSSLKEFEEKEVVEYMAAKFYQFIGNHTSIFYEILFDGISSASFEEKLDTTYFTICELSALFWKQWLVPSPFYPSPWIMGNIKYLLVATTI